MPFDAEFYEEFECEYDSEHYFCGNPSRMVVVITFALGLLNQYEQSIENQNGAYANAECKRLNEAYDRCFGLLALMF